ncbi:MAG: hypothetical protein ACOZIN_03855 [Myxococcota bacterium]
MTRRLLATLLLCVAAACGGLLVDKGNAFPCDFSQPEGERDKACAPGWVCGVSGECQLFRNEGPQFEGPPPLPVADAGTLIHPKQLRGEVRQVWPSAAPDGRGVVVVSTATGERVFSGERWIRLTELQGLDGGEATGGALYRGGKVLLRAADGRARVLSPNGSAEPVLGPSGLAARGVRGFRVGFHDTGLLKAAVLTDGLAGSTPSGELFDPGEGGAAYRVSPFVVAGADGGVLLERVEDVRWVPRAFVPALASGSEPLLPLVATASLGGGGGLYLRTGPGESWTRLDQDEPLAGVGPLALRHDRSLSVWTVASGVPEPNPKPRVLATFQVDRLPASPRLVRAWQDCAPCDVGHIVAFGPTRVNNAPAVEVLCARRAIGEASEERLSLVRVVGSTATSPFSACQLEALEPSIDLSRVVGGVGKRYALDEALGDQFAMGGKDGQVWMGSSLSTLAPRFLERVPRALGTFELPAAVASALELEQPADGRKALVMAGRYLAAELSTNGFAALDVAELSPIPLPKEVTVEGAVREANGWGLLSSADLARVSPSDGGLRGLSLSFGPRMLDGRGSAAAAPFHGDAVVNLDGGLVSFVLAADDSVYFWNTPGEVAGEPNALPPLLPQLTPEPTFPIRSMALERSPLGTDGVRFVRGYVVTSRNLFEFSLGGQPARWSARPLVVSSGEPVEVWMDHPRGALGRVGYRDGEVYTLPGGFPLVQRLPGSDGGSDRVLDYENLGGWPVALAESGLYVARWGVLPDGKLDNKFPDGRLGKTMTWRPLTLPDGTQPWLGKKAYLHVERRGVPGAATGSRYVLSVYAGPEVYEVATLTRAR